MYSWKGYGDWGEGKEGKNQKPLLLGNESSKLIAKSNMDLSKRDKKIARKLIDLGLQREFVNSLVRAGEILKQWNPNVEDNKPAYYALFLHITDFDKHITRRYDGLGGSRYYITVAGLLADGIITPEEIGEFSEDIQQRLRFYLG